MAPEPPRRSIIAGEFLTPDLPGQMRMLLTCDCGTATDLTIEVRGVLPTPQEAAFTCGGCQTPYWFTLTPAGEKMAP